MCMHTVHVITWIYYINPCDIIGTKMYYKTHVSLELKRPFSVLAHRIRCQPTLQMKINWEVPNINNTIGLSSGSH